MGQTMTLKASDGHEFSAYQADPATPNGCGLVVIQEIFGVNSHIRSVTDGFAADGYRAIAPALFDRLERGHEAGYEAPDVERGRALMGQIDFDDAVRDVTATVEALAADGLKVGVVGYCWGGSLAWAAATRIDGVGCAVGYYGGKIPDLADAQPRCPVMLHFGELDQGIPMDRVAIIGEKHPDLPLHIYKAGHGFNCDQRGSYDADSAALARQRTMAFFGEHLGAR